MTIVLSVVLAALAALGVVAAILFGHFKLDPDSVARNFEIQETTIVGPGSTKDDGTQVNGFILKDTDNDTEYLVTDYWQPIVLSDETPQS